MIRKRKAKEIKDKSRDSTVGTRRFFCRSLLSESVGLADEMRGKPQMILQDIPKLPDDAVSKMVPVLSPGDNYRIENGRLWLRQGQDCSFVEVQQFDDRQLWVINRFDGTRTLGEIVGLFHEYFNADREKAFRQIRVFFEILARHSICQPAGAHDED